MELGEGNSWIALLVGLLFSAICVPLALGSLIDIFRGLGRWHGRGRRKAGGKLRESLQILVFTSLGSMLALFVLFLGLVGQFPLIATWHPALTRVVDAMVDERKLASEMARGVQAGELGLIRLCLTLGADAQRPFEQVSWLNATRSLPARELLLQHGASPDGLVQQRHPLREAFQQQDWEGFAWLLGQGADPARHGVDDALALVESLALSDRDDAQGYFEALLTSPASEACRPDPKTVHGPTSAPCWLQQRASSGLSVLDDLVLQGLRPDWQQRLRSAGAEHGLLLDRGQRLTEDHPALRHVEAWLKARSVDPEWSRDDRRWILPQADRTGIPEYLPVPPLSLSGRGISSEALVRAEGLTRGGESVVYQIRAVPQLSEAQADPGPDVPWRISGYWQDGARGE